MLEPARAWPHPAFEHNSVACDSHHAVKPWSDASEVAMQPPVWPNSMTLGLPCGSEISYPDVSCQRPSQRDACEITTVRNSGFGRYHCRRLLGTCLPPDLARRGRSV